MPENHNESLPPEAFEQQPAPQVTRHIPELTASRVVAWRWEGDGFYQQGDGEGELIIKANESGNSNAKPQEFRVAISVNDEMRKKFLSTNDFEIHLYHFALDFINQKRREAAGG